MQPLCPSSFHNTPSHFSSSSFLSFFISAILLDISCSHLLLSSEEMKKAVLKLNLHDDKSKKKAMKIVSGLSGVDSISMDMKDQKLTVMGDIDPVDVATKLRKLCHTEIVSVGPAKEAEKKKEEPKKEEPKKPEQKKKEDAVAEWVKAYQAYNPQMTTQYYVRSAEEDPNSCVIC